MTTAICDGPEELESGEEKRAGHFVGSLNDLYPPPVKKPFFPSLAAVLSWDRMVLLGTRRQIPHRTWATRTGSTRSGTRAPPGPPSGGSELSPGGLTEAKP